MNVGARTKLIAIGALTAVAVIPASAAASVRDDFGPAANVTVHPETGKAAFVATEQGRALPAPTKGSPEAVALAFLDDHAGAFGIAGDDSSLSVSKVTPVDGGTSVRVQQEENGVPVIAGELIVNLDSAGEVLSVSGETSPSPGLGADAAISADEAADRAVAATAKHSGLDAADLEASSPELSILDSRLLDGPDLGPAVLVYRTEVTSPTHPDVNDFVAVDAETGAIALKFTQIHTALERHHCDLNNVPAAEPPCTVALSQRDEGQGPSGISDLDEAYDYTEDIYNFLLALGHDSLDDAGLPLFSTTRYCADDDPTCPYNNAFWNGEQMYYGQGLQSDDVVGHELGHGFTQYTSNLLYYYQSGAINESLSDVFGELMDQSNGAGSDGASDAWKLGEDISEDHFVNSCSPGPELRNMEDPTLCGDPDSMSSANYHTDQSDSGGVHVNSGVNNKAVFLMVDGGTFNGQTVTGIGIPKVSEIYYDTQTTMLTSGSDYQTLANGLRQSCADLVGTAGITTADCSQIDKAILAVEMDETPAGAPNPKAPVCNGADAPTNFFSDDMESGSGWTLNGWFYDVGYATSGDAMLFTSNPDVTSDKTATSPAINVPASVPAGGAFLRFNHAWGFEHDGVESYDGGVLEYSTAGAGGPWTDAESLITDVGYNGTLAASNPLAGRDAFVDVSNGYRATRVNLASFAGGTVHFRFRFTSDASVGFFPGWVVDDVTAYTCGAGTPNNPPVLASIGNKNATVGNQLSFQVSATDADADPLTYSASNLPAGASFNAATRTFTWTPTAAGNHPNVHFEVTDGTDTDSEDITINVTGGGANNPPVLASIGNKNATVGNQLSFQVSATDADADPLTYSASNLPAGASFNAATRTFTWTPTAAGNHPNVHFEVTDGTDTDSEDITINVTGGGDTTPPETTILSGPAKDTVKIKKGKRRAKVVYEYGSNENPVEFECNINSSGWQPCFQATQFKLGKGQWTLEARAVDAAGNVDPTPVSDSITVKKKKKNNNN